MRSRPKCLSVFNHAQLFNPDSEINEGAPNFVNGVNQGGTFGLVNGARDPRTMQVGAKLLF
jgi:hypothetical protein